MAKTLKDIRNQMNRLVEDININPRYSYTIKSSEGYIAKYKRTGKEPGDYEIEFTLTKDYAHLFSGAYVEEKLNILNKIGQEPEFEWFPMQFWIEPMTKEEYTSWFDHAEERQQYLRQFR